MSIRIVQLGTPRVDGEGIRIGTVRRPPRGVPKLEYSKRDYFDVWFPNLAPSADTMKLGRAAKTDREWARFASKYKSEMDASAAQRDLELLSAISHATNVSVGCYCEDESRCHRSILRDLLIECGAKLI